MINYASPWLIKLRMLGQRLGVVRPMVRAYRKIVGASYEETFDRKMMEQIRPGDVVWDIGANVGLFTVKFRDAVTKSGHVVAFEPAPSTYVTLLERCAGIENITCENIAISSEEGTLAMENDANSPTNQLGTGTPSQNSVIVNVSTIDALITNAVLPSPTAIKIDVEGYEYDVIKGALKALQSQKLRCLFIEMHFLEMNKRGLVDAPAEISSSLTSAGFALEWTDPSHIVATRR